MDFCIFNGLINWFVADAPICKYDKIMIVGASRDESVDVVCEVESDPPAKVIIHL